MTGLQNLFLSSHRTHLVHSGTCRRNHYSMQRGLTNGTKEADNQIYLCIGLQVIVEDIHTDSEISSVERIGSVPALRPKLSSFHYHSMEVNQGEQDALELILTGAHLKSVLCKHVWGYIIFQNGVHSQLSSWRAEVYWLQLSDYIPYLCIRSGITIALPARAFVDGIKFISLLTLLHECSQQQEGQKWGYICA